MWRTASQAGGRNAQAAYAKFIGWNMTGEGKRLLSNGSSAFWYRDDIFYCNWKAVARFVRLSNGKAGIFVAWDRWWFGKYDAYPRNKIFHVDDVCVWGAAAGMSMPVPEFLGCARRQWLARGEWLMDRVASATAPSSTDRKDYWLRSLAEAADDHDRAIAVLGLDWPKYPLRDMQASMQRLIEDKQHAYDDPRNVRKRERQAIRRAAIKALRLKEGKR